MLGRNNDFEYNKIREYYLWGNYQPLNASDFAKRFGEMHFTFFQKLVSSLFHEDVSVLFGYYASDLKISVKKIESFYKKGHKKKHIIACNFLLFEFFYDLLLFENHRDTEHFIAFFGKYQSLLVGNPGRVVSDYLETMEKSHAASNREKGYAVLKTLNAIAFILLHEWMHFQRDIVNNIIEDFRELEEFSRLVENISTEQFEESACDYMSLYLATSPSFSMSKTIEEKLGCSATTFLTYGFVLHQIDPLLQLLKLGFRSSFEDNRMRTEQIFQRIHRQTNNRCQTLLMMVKCSQKESDTGFGYMELDKALRDASTLIRDFFICLKNAVNLLADVIDNSDNATEMYTLNAPVHRDEIWFLIK